MSFNTSNKPLPHKGALLMRGFVSLCCALLVSLPAAAKTMEEWAEEYGIATDVSYEGTRVMETREGQFSFKERRAGQKSSIEVNMGGMSGRMIQREDLGKAYFLMPDMGMYREMNVRDAQRQSAAHMNISKVKEVGSETINGYPSRKFKTQFKDQHGKGAGFMWITEQGVPIKADMIYKNRGMKGERMTMELVDLVIADQDPSHFEIPPDLQPMNLSAFMSMAGEMQNAQANGTLTDDGLTENMPTEPRDPTLVEEMGEAAKDETRNTLLDETRTAVREKLQGNAVREGIRGLFRRRGN